ncbi:serine hydrolase domain-containing protein [Devosia sp.]|uniref:serine hydrolase domain-containing protein n=1 Tax=Devosia sp. TaxID=1871048 RepID=UPI001AC727A2|nr:serine hydrolase domain-containing protein [Devosia sp.]MBN9311336.1 beta-lactamase family protein [Devosia sp.]
MTLESRVNAAVDAALGSRIVGCVVLINQNGREIYGCTAGLADREANRKLERNAIWRLASVTKPIVATAALKMMEEGLLRLDDPVTTYLPYFTPPSPDGVVRPITLRQLFAHTSGLSYETVPADVAPGMSGPYISLEENLRRLAKAPLLFAPGTGWAYGTSIDVLGGVIAAINGSTLEAAVVRYAAGPLGMVDWRFTPTDATRVTANYANGDLPTPSIVPPARITMENNQGTRWEVDRIFRADAPQSGGGGSCGTADDVMKMLEVYNGGTFLKPATVAEALRNQIGDLPRRETDAGKRFTLLGAIIDDPRAARSPCPVGTLDWGGAWGHNWIIDPTNKLTILVCTNVAPEGCNGPFREDIRDAVYASL